MISIYKLYYYKININIIIYIIIFSTKGTGFILIRKYIYIIYYINLSYIIVFYFIIYFKGHSLIVYLSYVCYIIYNLREYNIYI